MRYLGIKVWTRTFEKDTNESTEDFDFDGVLIGERTEVFLVSEENDSPLFAIRLRITIANESGKLAPYDLDVDVAGFFKVSSSIPKDQREEFVTVNGCAVLYSAIRDQVMTISARGHHGVMILPTVNFLDKIKKKEPSNPVADKPQSKVRASARKKT